MKKTLLILILLYSTVIVEGQNKNVLFIGNSYTSVNNLPQMVADLASSTGDTMLFDSSTPGGATFYAHSLYTVTLNKIMAGNWDYVVLQGQSLQLLGYFPNVAVTFPEVGVLDSLINTYSPCGETMFYRTWGRKNGIGSFSYETMDSLIHVNYMALADTFNAVVSPVGEVWKYIRQNYPLIELYDPDESHPSVAGSYAAACCFYSAIFRKDPTLCTFNSTLLSNDALIIKAAAKTIVFDSLMKWHVGEYDSLFTNCVFSGMPEIENGFGKIYPNPATNNIILEFYKGHQHFIQLYNNLGILLKEMETTASLAINISDLPNGIYFLREKGESNGIKFVKQ